MADALLLLIVLGVPAATIWMLVTSPASIKEQNEMLQDEDNWP